MRVAGEMLYGFIDHLDQYRDEHGDHESDTVSKERFDYNVFHWTDNGKRRLRQSRRDPVLKG